MVETKVSSAGYAAPATLDEALWLLVNNADARVLAGGHGLLVEPGRSRSAAALLVDLRKVPGLTGIERDASGGVKIGAMTTLSAIAADAGLRKTHPTLVAAAALAGDPQLRNRATIGGSVASTSPEAEFGAVATALDATVQIASAKGSRSARAEELLGAALGSGEVITAVVLPMPAPRTGTSYQIVRNPSTRGPICGVVASVTLGGDGAVTASRIAITGAGPRPSRLPGAEKALAGKKSGGATAAAAGAAAAAETAARSDLFASADYRTHLTRVLTERAITQAFERAGG